MIANRTLISHKCVGVIKTYSEFAAVPLREAFGVFYKSNLYTEIRDGISDMYSKRRLPRGRIVAGNRTNEVP